MCSILQNYLLSWKLLSVNHFKEVWVSLSRFKNTFSSQKRNSDSFFNRKNMTLAGMIVEVICNWIVWFFDKWSTSWVISDYSLITAVFIRSCPVVFGNSVQNAMFETLKDFLPLWKNKTVQLDSFWIKASTYFMHLRAKRNL